MKKIVNWEGVADAISKKIFKGKTPGENIVEALKQTMLDEKTLEVFLNDLLDTRQEKLVKDMDERIDKITEHTNALVETTVIRTSSELTKSIVIAATIFGVIVGVMLSIVIAIK